MGIVLYKGRIFACRLSPSVSVLNYYTLTALALKVVGLRARLALGSATQCLCLFFN